MILVYPECVRRCSNAQLLLCGYQSSSGQSPLKLFDKLNNERPSTESIGMLLVSSAGGLTEMN